MQSHRVLSCLSKHSTRDPGVCRDEIALAVGVSARCQLLAPRPNVVVLLGDRCGWRPLSDDSLEAEFAPHA